MSMSISSTQPIAEPTIDNETSSLSEDEETLIIPEAEPTVEMEYPDVYPTLTIASIRIITTLVTGISIPSLGTPASSTNILVEDLRVMNTGPTSTLKPQEASKTSGSLGSTLFIPGNTLDQTVDRTSRTPQNNQTSISNTPDGGIFQGLNSVLTSNDKKTQSTAILILSLSCLLMILLIAFSIHKCRKWKTRKWLVQDIDKEDPYAPTTNSVVHYQVYDEHHDSVLVPPSYIPEKPVSGEMRDSFLDNLLKEMQRK